MTAFLDVLYGIVLFFLFIPALFDFINMSIEDLFS